MEVAQEELDRMALALPGHDIEVLTEIIAKAGATELLAQASGSAVFSTISDLRCFRILCLLKQGIRQGITLADAEVLVAALHKVPVTTARRFIQTALARYDVELSDSVGQAVAAALDAARWDADIGRWRVHLASAFIRDRLRVQMEFDEIIMPTRSTRGGEWLFAEESFDALRQALGLQPKQHA